MAVVCQVKLNPSVLEASTLSDIFISYKREEKPVAEQLATALEREGWSVWWDPHLHAGEHFDDAIEEALEEAACVVVLWSTQSVESRYVRDEATYALSRDKLIPVEIEDADLPFRFERLHTARLHDWDGAEDSPGYQRLIDDITNKIGPPSRPLDEGPTEPVESQDDEDGSESGNFGPLSRVISSVRPTDWNDLEYTSHVVVTFLLGFFYLFALAHNDNSAPGLFLSVLIGFPLSVYFIFKIKTYRYAWILAPLGSYAIGYPFESATGEGIETAFGVVILAGVIEHLYVTRSSARTTDWRNRVTISHLVVTFLLGVFYLLAIGKTASSSGDVFMSAIIGFPLSVYFIFKIKTYRYAWIVAPLASYAIGYPFEYASGEEIEFTLLVVILATVIDHVYLKWSS